MVSATLQIDDLVFSGRRGSVSRFYFKSLKDWHALSDSKTPIVERPQDHGGFDISEDKATSLAPSFEGFYSGTSRLDALNAQTRLKALRGQSGMRRVTMTDEDGSWSRWVSLRRIDIDDIRNQRVFTFHVYMVAPDPRLYGESVSVTNGLPASTGGLVWPITWPITWDSGGNDGRVTVQNSGTADIYADLQVSGGLGSGVSLTEVGTGREIRLEREIPVGSSAFFNQRTGRVYLDVPTNDISGFLTRSEWFATPAGGQSVIQFNSLGAVTGTPQLTATAAPARW